MISKSSQRWLLRRQYKHITRLSGFRDKVGLFCWGQFHEWSRGIYTSNKYHLNFFLWLVSKYIEFYIKVFTLSGFKSLTVIFNLRMYFTKFDFTHFSQYMHKMHIYPCNESTDWEESISSGQFIYFLCKYIEICTFPFKYLQYAVKCLP